MNKFQLKKIGEESAKAYYKFLEENNRGVIKIEVKNIKSANGNFVLQLTKNITFLESIIFEIKNQRYYTSQIFPVEYDTEYKTLVILPQPQFIFLFDEITPKDINVISDLKFLVKRVEEWYRINGNKIELPLTVPAIETWSDKTTDIKLSEDQKEAIQGILQNAFSYVWGAPGTGKTRAVLANSILGYVLNGRRILLIAPTNNAVEQMLLGILNVFEKNKISTSCILRLGIPSKEFAVKYPAVCEYNGLAKKIQQNNEQLKVLESCLRYKVFSENLSTLKEEIHNLFSSLKDEDNCKKRLCKEVEIKKGRIIDNKKEITQVQNEMYYLERRIVETNNKMNTIGYRVLNAFSSPKVKIKEDLLAAYNMSLSQLTIKNDILEAQLIKLNNEFEIDKKEYLNDKKICGIIDKIKKLCQFHTSIRNSTGLLNINNFDEIYQSVKSDISRLDIIICEKSVVYEKYNSMSIDKINILIRKSEKETDELKKMTSQNRVKEVNIVASTIDGYISRLSEMEDNSDKIQYDPEHIFMDEAGYCSLIKGLTLLSAKVPVTFLGDHMQLPPVCEMNEEQLKLDQNSSVFLWAQSSIFAEDVFCKSGEDMLADYISNEEATFEKMVKFDLIQSYRFGDSLASVLAKGVYVNTFSGNSSTGTEIIILNASRKINEKGRTNSAEVEAIKAFLLNNSIKDYAIITPYKNQVSLLGEKIKSAFKDERIMTIHASQGREWDTVLISIVDTYDKWFTNSTNKISKGKQVINTAVSRARNRLVIACDVEYWNMQPEQLISQLIMSADKIVC